MQRAAAKQLAEDFIGQYPDLAGWTVRFNNRARRTLGLCIYSRKIIQLSCAFVELNAEAMVAETVRHEIAHARVGPGHGHGRVWKRMAILVGAQPIACARNTILPPGRWTAACPTCERLFFMYLRPKPDHVRWCLHCGRTAGLLHFTASKPAKSCAKVGKQNDHRPREEVNLLPPCDD
jgi:predicted SprT family Zn-dependent metalloprotease